MKRREKILNALMESDSLTQAAEKAGCTRKTLYNYINNDSEFVSEYRAMCDRITAERLEQLEQATSTALQTITEVMRDKQYPPTARLKAAELILTATNEARANAQDYITRVDDKQKYIKVLASIIKQQRDNDLPENTQESGDF